MALGGIAGVLLLGVSWVFMSPDKGKQTGKDGEAETIETAGLVNRDLSQREFVTVYGNRLDAVTKAQKDLKDQAATRSDVDAELAALKAENQAMRTDGQAAIDALSAANADLKSQLANQQPASAAAPAATMPAYGPKAGSYDARGQPCGLRIYGMRSICLGLSRRVRSFGQAATNMNAPFDSAPLWTLKTAMSAVARITISMRPN